jgi:hypothetical protein
LKGGSDTLQTVIAHLLPAHHLSAAGPTPPVDVAGVRCPNGSRVLPSLQPSLPLWFEMVVGAALMMAQTLEVYPLVDREHGLAQP